MANGNKNPKNRYRPLPLREAMYERVLELYREGRRQAEIVRKIYEEFGEKLNRGQVSQWCRGVHRPGGNVRYNKFRICEDLGWILGARSRWFRLSGSKPDTANRKGCDANGYRRRLQEARFCEITRTEAVAV